MSGRLSWRWRAKTPPPKKLIAFIVPEGAVEERAVLGTVRERLPDYMVPSALVTLEALPLSGNGKVDRKRLLQTAGEAAFQESAAAPASSEAEKAVGRRERRSRAARC